MKITKIITAYNGIQPITSEETATMLPDDGTGFDVVNLYPQMKYQKISGFGGAITEAAGYVFSKMDQPGKQAFLNAYFGDNGSGYSLVRVSLDSCDFSLGHYTAMDNPNDTELISFSIHQDEQYVIPLIEAAQKVCGHPLALVLSPWSPPAFMKTTGQRNGGGSLKPEYRQLWANYICRYIKEYQKRGFTIKYLTVQNEPEAAQKWDSCVYTAEEEKCFLRDYLFPAMQKGGLDDVSLLIWDHNKEKIFERACDIIDDETNKMVDGIAFHWYSGDHFEGLALLRDKFPEKELVFTEGCVEYGAFKATAHLQHAQKYAHDILGNLNAGMSAFVDWNILLDEQGGPNHVGNFCDAPILFDTKAGTLQKNLSYDYIRHFSRYIKPGAHRIGMTKYTDKVEVTAFENADHSIASVLLNRTEHACPIALRVLGQIYKFELPASSICTVIIVNGH